MEICNQDPDEIIPQILLNLPCAIWWIDQDHKYIGCNIECCGLGGLHPQKILGRTILEIAQNRDGHWPKALTEEIYNAEGHVLQTGDPESKVIHAFPPNPGEKPLYQLCNKVPLFDLKRTIILGMIGVGILERQYNYPFKEKLENLNPNEFIIKNHPKIKFGWSEMFHMLPCSIWWIDKDHKYRGCNLEYCRTLGIYSQMELVGKTILDVAKIKKWPAGRAENIVTLDTSCMLSSGVTYNIENVVYQGNKMPSIRQIVAKKTLLDKNGKVDGLLCVAVYNGQFGEKSKWSIM